MPLGTSGKAILATGLGFQGTSPTNCIPSKSFVKLKKGKFNPNFIATDKILS